MPGETRRMLPGPHEQLVARDLGVRRVLAEGPQEQEDMRVATIQGLSVKRVGNPDGISGRPRRPAARGRRPRWNTP